MKEKIYIKKARPADNRHMAPKESKFKEIIESHYEIHK